MSFLHRARRVRAHPVLAAALLVITPGSARAQGTSAPVAAAPGYFRFPALADNQVIFTAEGDLWRVPLGGGTAQRITSHAAPETNPSVSPDGRTLAFSAAYEGPVEVYTMPLDGAGVPARRTFEGASATVVGWTPAGQVLYATRRWSGIPNTQLVAVDPVTQQRELVPLAQAADGSYDRQGALWFTRLAFQGSWTKRYQGGTAQNVWRFDRGANEAVPITSDYAGTSKQPMPWNGRVYFLSDRDGTMNVWSMAERGGDLRQHTKHTGMDAQSASLRDGRIVYQLGADLRVLDLTSGDDRVIPIRLVSDFEQMRERWVRNPSEWIGDAHLSPTGDRVVMTARGKVLVVPVGSGRVVEAGTGTRLRWRTARFMPDGKTLVGLNDRSGEVELWQTPANGVGEARQISRGATVLRWDGVPSPDGRWIAHWDKDLQLWLTEVPNGNTKRLGIGRTGDFGDVRWSPDSRFLAYALPAKNLMVQLWLYDTRGGAATEVTSDRYDSYSPAFSPDGAWLWFLSDRTFRSSVSSPWGPRQPEPFFDKPTKIYHVSLRPGLRSPFQPDDELFSAPARSSAADTIAKKVDSARAATGTGGRPPVGVAAAPPAPVNLVGIETRLLEVPLASGNYGNLNTDGERLYFTAAESAPDAKRAVRTLEISSKHNEPETFAENVTDFELSMDRKKVLLRRESEMFVTDAGPKAGDPAKTKLDLASLTLHVDPREEWRQIFADAWRMERDYFYDRGMNGVDWAAIRRRFEPLVERVTDRDELSDLLAQMVGELQALHIFVRGGDLRRGADQVVPATLGARLAIDREAGGWRVAHIYRTDPDRLDERSPLARVEVAVGEGDVILAINGVPTLSVPDPAVILRNQADKQVLLSVRPATGGEARQVVAVPVSGTQDRNLRYSEWEYERRLAVEKASKDRFGYVHLRAMGPDDIAQWAREFYPAFDRDGLIIDVRHNNGGNIDSWLLEKLLRKAWFYWQPRVGDPDWNMQYAFRGHVVVLIDENTASDGEAFAEGFRRLGLGKLIGTRTWGGEIWLSSSNVLVDRGIATAAEMGVFGPEGAWLIEGHGVDPDVIVDNLPHGAFLGKDAQLEAAIAYLEQRVKEQPIPLPQAPKYPVKVTPK